MICPFCQQWNPRADRRCTFCNNRLDNEEDTTQTGRPSYENHQGITLPEAGPDRYATPKMPANLPKMRLQWTRRESTIVGVIFFAALIIRLISC